jgi:hypothetical protein
MPKHSSRESKGNFNIDRLFNGATTATFVIELLSILVLIGAIVGYLLRVTGIWDLIKYNTDIIVFLLLIGGAIAFAIFMVFLGFFLRFHGRVQKFVIGSGIGRVEFASREAQMILTMFAFSVVFFFIAGVYGVYLLWRYILIPFFFTGENIFPAIIIATLAVLVVCLMVQAAAAAASRYAAGIVRRLTDLADED